MSDEIIEVDELIGPNKKVRIAGQVYDLPGDIPIDTFLEIANMEERLEDEDVDEAELMISLRDRVSELFLLCDPEFEWPPTLGVTATVRLVGLVYRGAAARDAEGGADPTPTTPPKVTRGVKPASVRKPANSRKPKATPKATPEPSAS